MTLARPEQIDDEPESQSSAHVTPKDVRDELASRKIPRKTMVLWLVALSLIVFFLPLFLFSNSIVEDVQGLSSDLGFIQTSMTKVPTPVPAIQRLLTPIAQVQGQQAQLDSVIPTVAAPRPDWASIMTAIGSYRTEQITLTSVSQTAMSLTLAGRATSDTVVTAYAHSLEQSGIFSRVVLQSIRTVPITATVTVTKTSTATVTLTPTPTLTNAPTNAPTNTATFTPTPTSTPTTTPDLRDAYEPDDATPKSIYVGETQSHNFYPSGDVDKVSFPAKKDRYYQVLTSNLALGVDTIVTVNLGNQQWMNDDYAPGTGNFASAVCFQAPQDGTAVATIINRTAQYGANKTYQVKVSEVQNLAAPPCIPPTAAPTPSQKSELSGRLALLSFRMDSPASANDLLDNSPMYEFVIIVELKVKTP